MNLLSKNTITITTNKQTVTITTCQTPLSTGYQSVVRSPIWLSPVMMSSRQVCFSWQMLTCQNSSAHSKVNRANQNITFFCFLFVFCKGHAHKNTYRIIGYEFLQHSNKQKSIKQTYVKQNVVSTYNSNPIRKYNVMVRWYIHLGDIWRRFFFLWTLSVIIWRPNYRQHQPQMEILIPSLLMKRQIYSARPPWTQIATFIPSVSTQWDIAVKSQVSSAIVLRWTLLPSNQNTCFGLYYTCTIIIVNCMLIE